MADSKSVRIEEPFGTVIASGDVLKVTPPHGMFSARDYSFDRGQQRVTVSDKKFGIFGSKKNHDFEYLSFRLSMYGANAEKCVEMSYRMPGKPLIVYQLTGLSGDTAKIDTVKTAITDATGIDRWEGA